MNKKAPKISVVIPAYNVAPYLNACAQSVLSQSMTELELIIINDGSTDDTGRIADKIASQDSRVKTLHQPNGGASAARNAGIIHATGIYICFVDGDDLITENMLEEMYHMIESTKADVCVGAIRSFRNPKTIPDVAEVTPLKVVTASEATEILLYEKGILNSQCAKLYKRSVLGNTRFEETIAFGEDMYFNYTVFKAARVVTISAFAPYYYLQRPGSAMRARFNVKRADSLLIAKRIQRDIAANKLAGLVDAATNKLFTESVAIAGLMPITQRKTQLFRDCLHFIDTNKRFVFNNPSTGKKNRLFSGLAILSKMLLINLLLARNNIRRKLG